MIHEPALLDSDTLSEFLKGYDKSVQQQAKEYLLVQGRFQFSIITRYEILKGLMAKGALRQVATFQQQCRKSAIFPLTNRIVERASEIYGFLRKRGALIEDADILIAATALINGLQLVTGNLDHFNRIPDLRLRNWRAGSVADQG